MKIGILGGSFNPVHNGHVELGKNVVKELGLDKLFFVPAFVSPFKQDVKLSVSDDNRIEMLKLAIAESNCKELDIELCEIEREGVSYTIDTVEYLNKKYDTKVFLVIGDDLVQDFSKWKDPLKLQDAANIVLARRHNVEPIAFSYKHQTVKNNIVLGASSDIRALISTEGEWEKFVPKTVSDYIKEKSLYGYWQGMSKKINEILKTAVTEKRYNHSVRVAEMMEKLCIHYGLNSDMGYFAGIAHDLCKYVPENELFEIVAEDAMEITKAEKESPVLLHGRAAAVVLKRDYGVINKDVLEGIAFHTFGKPYMSEIGMLLFVADKIEPGRPQACEEYYNRLFSLSLKEMTLSVLEENIQYLHNKGKEPSDLSFDMQKWLKKECMGE